MKLHILVSLAYALFFPTSAAADILFESGTLGPTGITWQQLLDDEPVGSNVASEVFSGVRFELTQPVVTTRVGGHIVSSPATVGTFFGAIVKLDDEFDFPNSGDLSTPDVVGSTVIAFPYPSAEVFGDLSLSLDPGWYALVFGSGLLGAIGDGAMPLNNPDIGSPTYIGFQPGAVLGWGNLINPIFRNYRFVVEGTAVPEPTSVLLAFFCICVVASSRFRRQQ
jgi:hypothetical protein